MASNGIGGDIDLQRQIERLKEENEDLQTRLRLLQGLHNPQLSATEEHGSVMCGLSSAPCPKVNRIAPSSSMSPDMVHRYSRHLLLPDFGVEGQLKLSRSSILVVGAGGLGSPVAMYLAACGVGCLGIVDDDIVELNNLHRQIIHTEAYVGQSKVKSAAASCLAINSSVKLVEHQEALRPQNALDIVSKYDIVVDATDNLSTRYMISDCCVLLDKPHIFGAALGLEGQVTVYHHKGGPCFRCLFPTPPPAAACQRCSDSGVLGVVPGVIGCLQALEAIKVASDVGEPLCRRMLLFDALSSRIRTVELRSKSPLCPICGDNSEFTPNVFRCFDYENFTQSPMSDKLSGLPEQQDKYIEFMYKLQDESTENKLNMLNEPKKVQSSNNLRLIPESSRISSKEYSRIFSNGEPHLLVDVRPEHLFKITFIPESVNVPLSTLQDKLSTIDSALKQRRRDSSSDAALYLVCRRGNDSQIAVDFLAKNGFPLAKDIIGGLESWDKEV